MNVVGFGACMIDGYGVGKGNSFYDYFINKLKENMPDVKSRVISLGGFPINRVIKYLDKRVVSLNPLITVVQFGSTDLTIKLSSKIKNVYPTINRPESSLSNSNVFHLIRWYAKGLISCFLRIKPLTSKEVYLDNIETIIDRLSSKSLVIVLSPFPRGDWYTNCFIQEYIKGLKMFEGKHNTIIIDCYAILSSYTRTKILLNDGFHLSREGHAAVGEKLWNEFREKYILPGANLEQFKVSGR